VVSVPLSLSVWALLDAARRPAWAWSLANRSQAMWVGACALGILLMVVGLFVSISYLVRIRPQIAAAEDGVTFFE
jgi:hypothetical protein